MGRGLLNVDSAAYWVADHAYRWYEGHRFQVGLHLIDGPAGRAFLRGGFVLTTLFEIASPLCLVSAAFRRVFVPFMLLFHLLAHVLINIVFLPHLLLYVFLFDLDRTAAVVGKMIGRGSRATAG
jgi:hypothetical protein